MPRRGPFDQQVVQHRLTRRPGQRQDAAAAGLRREDDDLVVRPVDVGQPQRPDFASAQAVAGDQQQHRVVASAIRLVHLDRAEQATHLLPRQGARHLGEPVAPPQRHRAHQVRAAVPAQIHPPIEARQRRGEMVPRGAPQPNPAPAAERKQVVRAQRHQRGRAHRSAPADQEVTKVTSVVDHRRFGEPAITTQEPAVALDQLVVERLVHHDRRDGTLLAQHHQQMRQSPADRFFSMAHRAAATATPRQMTGEEVRDDPVITNLLTSQLFVHDPAEVNDGMPVVPTRSLGTAALTQPHGQPNGLGPERGLLPAHVEQPVPKRFVHCPPPRLVLEVKRRTGAKLYVKCRGTPDREVTDSATQLHITPDST